MLYALPKLAIHIGGKLGSRKHDDIFLCCKFTMLYKLVGNNWDSRPEGEVILLMTLKFYI